MSIRPVIGFDWPCAASGGCIADVITECTDDAYGCSAANG